MPFPQIEYKSTETQPHTSIHQPKTNNDSSVKKEAHDISKEIFSVTLYNKEFTEQEYQKYIFFTLGLTGIGLDKQVRAAKGILVFTDIFDEPKFKIKFTINDSLTPGIEKIIRGKGFKYNQFINEHQWVRNTNIKDMKVYFRVKSLFYSDGSKRDL